MTSAIRDKKIVIFGYGAQGRAHALNLQDSGLDITICLPKTSLSISEVKSSNFPLITNPIEAAKIADIAVIMVPDSAQKDLYNEIKDLFPRNSALIFAHGLNIHYKLIEPREDLDIILVAPMAQGEAVRKMYLKKLPIPTLIASDQNVTGLAWEIARAYATGIGSSHDKLVESTFQEETETDLFSEQTLICGGVWSLITAAFDTLVDEGYQPEIAYYCCLKEIKIMTEMFARYGILGTFERVSDTARYGALSRGPRVIDQHVKDQMKNALAEIRDGRFIKEMNEEAKKGEASSSSKMMQKIANHRLEVIHKKISKGEEND